VPEAPRRFAPGSTATLKKQIMLDTGRLRYEKRVVVFGEATRKAAELFERSEFSAVAERV